jgi:ABC-type Fe3+/spermidine/putrescine transport system ATPase subunit
MGDPVLQVTGVRRQYGDVAALAGVDLAVAEGESVCLLGPSGCGKTTLLRLIAGLESADSGTIHHAGRDLTGVPPHRRDFGLMFQDFALFPHLTVGENVAYGLKMRGIGRSEQAERAAGMLALVDLAGTADRTIDQLSGGERQRVALARALAPRPRLLLLDEPLGALDRALRERLMIDLRLILNRVGVTAIYVTHDQTEAYAIGDRVAVMQAGRIAQIAPPEQLYRQPRTPFVARFLGFDNLLPGRTVAGGVETALGRLPVGHGESADCPVTLLIPPDALALAGDSTGGVLLPGTLHAAAFRGRWYLVQVRVGEVLLSAELPRLPDRTPGTPLTLQLDPARCLVLA